MTPTAPQQTTDTSFEGRPERRLPGHNRPQGRRGGGAMKFLQSLRGEGVLLVDAHEQPVSYQLDVFESSFGRTGSGVVEGVLSDAISDGPARLRLAGGEEFPVLLQDVDAEGAAFETRAAPKVG